MFLKNDELTKSDPSDVAVLPFISFSSESLFPLFSAAFFSENSKYSFLVDITIVKTIDVSKIIVSVFNSCFSLSF